MIGKFLNIKTHQAGFTPAAVVIVATIRALKMHGGVNKKELGAENVEALLNGISNLEKHVETIKAFGVPYIVAINSFITDTKGETEALSNYLETNNHPWSLSEVGNMVEMAQLT